MKERMQLVIHFSRLNIEHHTGGPFAAAVFDMKTNQLIAAGVNMVEKSNLSIAHAEIVALTHAQQIIGSYNLGDHDATYELVTTTEPCAMCSGAIPWSGIRQLVCGATGEDAERIGFDEGAKHPEWIQAFETRKIAVITKVCREKAASVLNDYVQLNGLIYCN
ncbi:MAG: nucleoside deaminase [Mariprofundaceae bacterium]